MQLLKQQEYICRETGNSHGLAGCLTNQAFVLADGMGRADDAFRLAEEAYHLAKCHNFGSLKLKIKPLFNSIRSKL
jgi:hypothetical protein